MLTIYVEDGPREKIEKYREKKITSPNKIIEVMVPNSKP